MLLHGPGCQPLHCVHVEALQSACYALLAFDCWVGPASPGDRAMGNGCMQGGLAGCMAALSAYETRQASGGQLDIVLVDKMKIGGNSAKASSGINALTPPSGDTPQARGQRAVGVRVLEAYFCHTLAQQEKPWNVQCQACNVMHCVS